MRLCLRVGVPRLAGWNDRLPRGLRFFLHVRLLPFALTSPALKMMCRVCRHFLSKFRHFLDRNKHVDALSRVIDDKGSVLSLGRFKLALANAVLWAVRMPLICLVRLAPISFGYSNLLFASIPSVDLPRFLLGTLAITPKLFLHIFTGNRMYKFADPAEREKLDKSGKILNGVSIAVSVALGMGVGLYVWRLTMKRA